MNFNLHVQLNKNQLDILSSMKNNPAVIYNFEDPDVKHMFDMGLIDLDYMPGKWIIKNLGLIVLEKFDRRDFS